MDGIFDVGRPPHFIFYETRRAAVGRPTAGRHRKSRFRSSTPRNQFSQFLSTNMQKKIKICFDKVVSNDVSLFWMQYSVYFQDSQASEKSISSKSGRRRPAVGRPTAGRHGQMTATKICFSLRETAEIMNCGALKRGNTMC